MGKHAYGCCSILFLGLSLSICTVRGNGQEQQVQAASESPAPATYKLHVKKGSRDDIEAIGKRKIVDTDFYSLNKESQIGKEEAERVEKGIKLLQDPSVTEYIKRIGQNLAQNSDATVPFTIKVVDSDEANAFSLPGGYLYVSSGLILDCANEAELAGVMSHAVAHVAARHATRLMTRAMLANILSKDLVHTASISDPPKSRTALSFPLALLKFRREFELEADYFGIQYLYRASYNPLAFVSWLEREDKRQQVKPSSLATKFSAQPQPAERIVVAKEEIARILPPTAIVVVNTLQFDAIKAKLVERKNKSQQDKQAPK